MKKENVGAIISDANDSRIVIELDVLLAAFKRDSETISKHPNLPKLTN